MQGMRIGVEAESARGKPGNRYQGDKPLEPRDGSQSAFKQVHLMSIRPDLAKGLPDVSRLYVSA